MGERSRGSVLSVMHDDLMRAAVSSQARRRVVATALLLCLVLCTVVLLWGSSLRGRQLLVLAASCLFVSAWPLRPRAALFMQWLTGAAVALCGFHVAFYLGYIVEHEVEDSAGVSGRAFVALAMATVASLLILRRRALLERQEQEVVARYAQERHDELVTLLSSVAAPESEQRSRPDLRHAVIGALLVGVVLSR